jgi:hypothetical protein
VLVKKYPSAQDEAVEAEAQTLALAVQADAEQAPLDNQNPSLQVKATVLEEQVAALDPQAEQTPLLRKNPV